MAKKLSLFFKTKQGGGLGGWVKDQSLFIFFWLPSFKEVCWHVIHSVPQILHISSSISKNTLSLVDMFPKLADSPWVLPLARQSLSCHIHMLAPFQNINILHVSKSLFKDIVLLYTRLSLILSGIFWHQFIKTRYRHISYINIYNGSHPNLRVRGLWSF